MINLYRAKFRKGDTWEDFVRSKAFLESTKGAVQTMVETGNETRYVAVRDTENEVIYVSPIISGKPYEVDGLSTRKGRKEVRKESKRGGKYLFSDVHFHPDDENRDPVPIPSYSDLYVCDIQTRNFKGKMPVFGVGKYFEGGENPRTDIIFFQRKRDPPYLSFLMSRVYQALNLQRPFVRKFRKSLTKEWRRRMEEGIQGDPYKDVVEKLEKTNLYNVSHLSLQNEGLFTGKNLDVFSQ